MNAPKMSQTVLLAKPDSAHVSAASGALKPGFASSAGPNSTYGASTATSVTPMRPMAPPGRGSTIRATITPAKIAKKYHACSARPAGGGKRASASVTPIGSSARQERWGTLSGGAVSTFGVPADVPATRTPSRVVVMDM